MIDFVVGDVVLIEAVVLDDTPTFPGELWVDFLGEGRWVPIASIVENKGQPEPDEPTYYGALVEDKDGDVWVRDAQGAWVFVENGIQSRTQTWTHVLTNYGPVTVRFEGIAE